MTREGRMAVRRLRAQALRATLSALGRRREGWEWTFIRERWGFVPAAVARAASGHPVVWISSAPGGELIQTYSLCRRLKEALPDFRIFLSTTNARSLGFARTVPGTDGVFFSPWDLPGPVRRALRTLQPRLVLAIEAALDPILYREARRMGAVTMLASGYMSNSYHRHPTYERSIALDVFDHLDWIAAKSDSDRGAFVSVGVPKERGVVLGDLRYDREYFAVSEAERNRLRNLLGLAPGERVLVAGSVRTGEEDLVIDGFIEARRSLPGLRLLIAPRFPREVDPVISALRSRGEEFRRRTELRGGPSRGVLILDSFGELARLYSLASFVFLGGSVFPQDGVGLGQNLIEPLAQGAPIFFGFHMNHWADIVTRMVAIYPGLCVTVASELAGGIVELDRRPDLVGRLQAVARVMMAERSGGLQEHVAFIQKLLAER